MRYFSTRGAEGAGLVDAVMRGLAADGGLFVPDELPRFDPARRARRVLGRNLGRGARAVLRRLGPRERARRHLPRCVRFSAAVETARANGELAVLELFHGPTAAFKDVGARFLAALMERALRALDGFAAADDSRRDLGRHRRRGRRSVPSAARHSRRRAVPEGPGVAAPAAPAHVLGRQRPRVRGRRHVRRLPSAREGRVHGSGSAGGATA